MCRRKSQSSLYQKCNSYRVMEKNLICVRRTKTVLAFFCNPDIVHVAPCNLYLLKENNSCQKERASLFYIACQNSHYSTVQIKLNNNVDINVCEVNGVSTLYLSINSNQNGHNSTLHFFRNEERKNMSSRQSLWKRKWKHTASFIEWSKY